jgi:hypothetical protein
VKRVELLVPLRAKAPGERTLSQPTGRPLRLRRAIAVLGEAPLMRSEEEATVELLPRLSDQENRIAAGLRLEPLYGGFAGEPFDDDSGEYVFRSPPLTVPLAVEAAASDLAPRSLEGFRASTRSGLWRHTGARQREWNEQRSHRADTATVSRCGLPVSVSKRQQN